MVCYDLLLQLPFCEDESVQLFRVAFWRSDFLQNPYFSVPHIIIVEYGNSKLPSTTLKNVWRAKKRNHIS